MKSLYMIILIIGVSFLTIAHADDWFESEEASCFDYAEVTGIQIQSDPVNEKVAEHTPKLGPDQKQILMADAKPVRGASFTFNEKMNMDISAERAINSPPRLGEGPARTGHWFDRDFGCAEPLHVWVGPDEKDPVITMCPVCFAGDTPITTDTGIKTISSIIPGEMVLGMNGFRKVLYVTEGTSAPRLSINGIKTTPNHPFVMADGHLKKAEDLKIGDVLFGGIKVEKIKDILEEEPTYNLIVEDDTYYVKDMLVFTGVNSRGLSGKTPETISDKNMLPTAHAEISLEM